MRVSTEPRESIGRDCNRLGRVRKPVLRSFCVIGGLMIGGGCISLNSPARTGGSGGAGAESAPEGSAPLVSPAGLPLGTVTIGAHTFRVEFAETFATRVRGLMFRRTLAADAGMYFVFDEPEVLSFWMLNTLIPLDIAFIREDLTIANIDTMQPETTNQHYSNGPALYALEVPAGELARRGIRAGDVVTVQRNP